VLESILETAEWVVRGSPYIIVYEVNMDQDELVILAVFHGSRSRT
jgi:plasmid stabilization system protein ParE